LHEPELSIAPSAQASTPLHLIVHDALPQSIRPVHVSSCSHSIVQPADIEQSRVPEQASGALQSMVQGMPGGHVAEPPVSSISHVLPAPQVPPAAVHADPHSALPLPALPLPLPLLPLPLPLPLPPGLASTAGASRRGLSTCARPSVVDDEAG
jgi:hypothetical protein